MVVGQLECGKNLENVQEGLFSKTYTQGLHTFQTCYRCVKAVFCQ